ncbi:ECF sigma factor (fragment) [metagenome]|uniref:ECF sigma factor n=1 Tax=metagenome TaxID=256318 RepID=A0A2P2C9F2_9ZZZZ
MARPEVDLDGAVQRMLDGHEESFRQVYRSVHPPLLRYLGALVGESEAEDVASETWAQAFRDLGRFSGDADGFRGWVTTIGRHRALDHLRMRGRRPVAQVDLGHALDLPATTDVESSAIALLGTEGALRLIKALPQDQAEAVMLRAVMGLDAKTAGTVLGKRPGAVRSAAHRGLTTLLRRLTEETSTSDRPTLVRDIFSLPGAEEVT